MAGASLLALLDDIASVLDDVAMMTKVAAKKTAGVLGDDLALNAQQVAGDGAGEVGLARQGDAGSGGGPVIPRFQKFSILLHSKPI